MSSSSSNQSQNNNSSAVENGGDLGMAGKTAKMFIHSPLTPLFFVALLLMGLMGLYFTPRQEDPQISVPMADIFFQFPGASAEQVASLATDPLERMMKEIQGVKHVYSASQRGGAMVTVQFKVGEEMGPSLVKLYDKLASNLDKIPPGVSRPLIKPRGVDDVPVVTFTLWSNDVNDSGLRLVALEAMQRLMTVDNTAQAFIVGGRPEAMRVEIIPERLKGYGISVQQLARTVSAANTRRSIGDTEQGGQNLKVYTGRFLRHAADIENLIVGVQKGSPVYVRDVAKVIEGPADAKNLVQYFSGPAAKNTKENTQQGANAAPAVTIAVAKKNGTNGVSVANDLIDKMEILKGRVIPDNINIAVTRNYGKTANDKVNGLLLKMVIATAAVCFLIYLFLGLRPTVVVALVIPVVVLITVFIAWLMGFTIDRVSLFALIFSIGILVDDATVVVENIYRRWLIKGSYDTETTIDAVREVGNPTILATFTVIAALLPMGFVSGMMGPYMMPIPALGSVAMLASLFAAFMFTPWLAIRIRPSTAALHKMEESEKKFSSRLDRLYQIVLVPLLDSPRKARMFRISIWVVFLACCALFYTQSVTVKMLPLDNKPEFNVVVNMTEGTALPETANAIQSLTEQLRTLPEVTALQTYTGTASPFNFNGLVRHYYLRDKSWQGDIQVQLTDKGDRKRSSHEIAVEARALLTPIAKKNGFNVEIVEMPPGPPVLQTMVAEIYGPDAKTRRQVARDMTEIFRKAETVVDVDNYMTAPHDTLSFVVNQQKAEHQNVTIEDISRQLAMIMGGYKIGAVKVGHELEPRYITIQAPLNIRAQFSRIGEVPIQTRDGRLVPLADLGRFERQPQDEPVFHKDLRPVEYVTGEVAGRLAAPVYGMIEISKLLKDYKTPDGVELSGGIIGPPSEDFTSGFEWTGEWTVTYETFRDMGMAFMAALILIYMLVVMEFGNFRLPGIIMAPIPLTLIGIIPGHWLLGASFTATSMIGWIALAGIIVRNSILLVDFSKHAVDAGTPIREAVLQAVSARTRPIVITSLALIAGSASIITDPIFQGMAISLLFGAIVSTALTLIVIPMACANATSAYRSNDIGDEPSSAAITGPSGPGGPSGSGGPGSAAAPATASVSGKEARVQEGSQPAAGVPVTTRIAAQAGAAGASFKALASKKGYGWLKPVYIAGAFSSESVGHLLGKAPANATSVTGSASAKVSTAVVAQTAANKVIVKSRPKSRATRMVAPVGEAMAHLLGRIPAPPSQSSAAAAPNAAQLAASIADGRSIAGGKKAVVKVAAGKSPAKKPAASKSVAKKPAAKKPAAKQLVARKAIAKKALAVKTPAKKPAAKKALPAKSSARKSPAKPAPKTAAKQSAAKKKPAPKNAAKSANDSAKKTSARTGNTPPTKPAAKTAPANKAATAKANALTKPEKRTKSAAKSATKSAINSSAKTKPKDNLAKISGIGPGLVKKLNAEGIMNFQDIARWKKSDIAHFDDVLSFKGRISRDDWVGQAQKFVRVAQMRAASSKLTTKPGATKAKSKSKTKSKKSN